MKRAQNQLRRVLTLIDVLAHRRMPFTIQDAIHDLEERSGSKVTVCIRTIQRDMELLVSMNFAYVYRAAPRGAPEPALFKMNLILTTNVQRAAAKARSLTAHSWHDAEQSPQQPNFPASPSEPEQHHSSDTAFQQPCSAGNPE